MLKNTIVVSILMHLPWMCVFIVFI